LRLWRGPRALLLSRRLLSFLSLLGGGHGLGLRLRGGGGGGGGNGDRARADGAAAEGVQDMLKGVGVAVQEDLAVWGVEVNVLAKM
jgi:hypothetical protein